MRIDKFLKVSRILKRRTVSKELAVNQRIEINGRIVKPAHDVSAGDTVSITLVIANSRYVFYRLKKSKRRKTHLNSMRLSRRKR